VTPLEGEEKMIDERMRGRGCSKDILVYKKNRGERVARVF
jgi:hypothetical protein